MTTKDTKEHEGAGEALLMFAAGLSNKDLLDKG